MVGTKAGELNGRSAVRRSSMVWTSCIGERCLVKGRRGTGFAGPPAPPPEGVAPKALRGRVSYQACSLSSGKLPSFTAAT